MIAQGHKGSIELADGNLIIRTKGAFGTARADQTVIIDSIQTVHFKAATMRQGFIFFETPGSIPFGQTAASRADQRINGLKFDKEHQTSFESIRDEVTRKISA